MLHWAFLVANTMFTTYGHANRAVRSVGDLSAAGRIAEKNSTVPYPAGPGETFFCSCRCQDTQRLATVGYRSLASLASLSFPHCSRFQWRFLEIGLIPPTMFNQLL